MSFFRSSAIASALLVGAFVLAPVAHAEDASVKSRLDARGVNYKRPDNGAPAQPKAVITRERR